MELAAYYGVDGAVPVDIAIRLGRTMFVDPLLIFMRIGLRRDIHFALALAEITPAVQFQVYIGDGADLTLIERLVSLYQCTCLLYTSPSPRD